MSLPHVLLGLLHEEPRTGYDLARALREEVEPAWSAGFSQIYPALARLRRRGWVLLRVLGPRRGPRRLLYRVTASGRRELRRWLEEPPSAPEGHDEGLARLAFLDVLPVTDRRRALNALEAAVAADVARLRQLPSPRGHLGFARRAAIEQREALRRFLRGGGAGTDFAPPRKKR
jgi:DNA-binding PadR family transcriptional regulator